MSRAKVKAVKRWAWYFANGTLDTIAPASFNKADCVRCMGIDAEHVLRVEIRPVPARKRKPRRKASK